MEYPTFDFCILSVYTRALGECDFEIFHDTVLKSVA